MSLLLFEEMLRRGLNSACLFGHLYLIHQRHEFSLELTSAGCQKCDATDGGETWSPAINVVNNDVFPSPFIGDQFFPFVVTSHDGTEISVMYYDRSDFPNNDFMHVKVSISMDGGLSFIQPVRITDVPSYSANTFIGDYNRMVASPDPNFPAKVFPIWADRRNGNPDIFMSSADVPIAVTVSTQIISGWQALSVPVVVPDFAKTAVWPTATSSAFAFVPTGS